MSQTEEQTVVEEAVDQNMDQNVDGAAEENIDLDGASEIKSESDSVSVKDHPDFVELNNKYLRLHAEFDNFRRRSARESLEVMTSANAKIMGRLVDVLENFERATDAEHTKASVEDYSKGVLLIKDQFSNTLKEFGLNILDPQGEKFDPNFHEALMQQPSAEVAEEHILQVFQKGYKLNDKVIKHAKVIVSAGS